MMTRSIGQGPVATCGISVYKFVFKRTEASVYKVCDIVEKNSDARDWIIEIEFLSAV